MIYNLYHPGSSIGRAFPPVTRNWRLAPNAQEEKVAGSIPARGTKALFPPNRGSEALKGQGVWLKRYEHGADNSEASGSNPLTPTSC